MKDFRHIWELIFTLALTILFVVTCVIMVATKFRADEPTETVGAVRIEAPTALMQAHTDEALRVIADDPYVNLGEYKITAYCACEACCGAYGANRPIGEDGKPIVYTASMAVAKQGVTVAADTSIHPFGTVLKIDGTEYTVQDRGGAIKGKRIDIFFDNHEEALQFGVQYKDVFLKEGA